MVSQIKVDSVLESSSGNGVTVDGVLLKDSKLASGTGNILQTKSQFFDTQTNIANTTSFQDTGLTLAITPSATSSKILCMFYPSFSGEDNSYIAFKMFRDSTEIGSSTVTGTGLECFTGMSFRDTGNLSYSTFTFPLIFLDSPSTTSAVTYKLQASPMRTSNKNMYINRSYNLGDDNQFRSVSNVILMEVGG